MSPIWIIALVVIVVALLGWCAGVLVVSSRRRRATGHTDPAPLPEDRDEINGGVFRGDPGATNRPPGEP